MTSGILLFIVVKLIGVMMGFAILCVVAVVLAMMFREALEFIQSRSP